MTETEICKEHLLEIIEKLSDESIKRIYRLAEYLYIYKEDDVVDE